MTAIEEARYDDRRRLAPDDTSDDAAEHASDDATSLVATVVGGFDDRRASARGWPRVSLVLPTRDRPTMVRSALASVLAGEVVPDEIIVVDQSRPPLDIGDLVDPSVQTGGCRLRLEISGPGLSRAVNHGARLASGDVLVVTHDDVLADRDWLRELAGALVELGEGVVVTGRVAASDPERPGAFAPALRDDPRPAVYSGRVERCAIRPMNIALWRRDHLAIGGYDERLGPGTPFPGGEDHDYSVRLLDAGLTVHYRPAARVRHRAWRDRRDYLPLRWHYGLAHGAFYARSYDPADRHILHRVSTDVRRRLRLVPRALMDEPRVGVGHVVFLLASVVGAVRWRCRYGRVANRPTSLGRPVIDPVSPGTQRPRWSVMIPAYDCGRFLEIAVDGVLAQALDADQMQIEVVDDHSTKDDPTSIVHRVAGNRVLVHRHPENRGNIGTFNTCLQRSTGHYVHLLHGDDQVFPGFYERLGRALDDNPRCVAAICGHILIDEDGEVMKPMPTLASGPGILERAFERFVGGNLIQAPAIVVRRDAYEAVGGFDARINSYGEDWEMWTRLAALGPIWYEPTVLAAYRVRLGSITSALASSRKTLDDMMRVIAINREIADRTLPASVARRRTAAARRWAAERTARRCLRCIDRGATANGLALMRAALGASRSPLILLHAGAVPVRWSARRVNQRRDRWRARRRHDRVPA